MTIRYNSYIQSLSDGTIDLNNVSMSVIVVSKYYKPKETNSLINVTSRILQLDDILQQDDINTLSMSDIMNKIEGYAKVYNFEQADLSEVSGFVVFESESKKLFFYEDINIGLNNN